VLINLILLAKLIFSIVAELTQVMALPNDLEKVLAGTLLSIRGNH
jgi:hypothetical protein